MTSKKEYDKLITDFIFTKLPIKDIIFDKKKIIEEDKKSYSDDGEELEKRNMINPNLFKKKQLISRYLLLNLKLYQ